MTINELGNQLQTIESIDSLESYLCSHIFEIRSLFYGLTLNEIQQKKFDYEYNFSKFELSSVWHEMNRTKQEQVKAIPSLLIFFISFFERANIYHLLPNAANLLSSASLRQRILAIFEYKWITNSLNDYIERFDKIMKLLESASKGQNETVKSQCEDIIIEYFTSAVKNNLLIGYNIRNKFQMLFEKSDSLIKYPLLQSSKIKHIFALTAQEILYEADAVRSRIFESLYNEAWFSLPQEIIQERIEETQGEELTDTQMHIKLPAFLDDALASQNAFFKHDPKTVTMGLNADHERNQGYLGTFFPRSFIESWNIFSEIISIPEIQSALKQKDNLRILDVGSGTGGSLFGTLMSLKTCNILPKIVETLSIDGNEDALNKQKIIMNLIEQSLPFEINPQYQTQIFNTNLDDYIKSFSCFSKGRVYDIIICWKHLSEFYNADYVKALGIIRNALKLFSDMLVSNGICIILDITTTDSKYEFFPMILNRESNEYESDPERKISTIIPISCAKKSGNCNNNKCYNQRVFNVQHRLSSTDRSKIVYRVYAPNRFASTIISSYTTGISYRVNAARPKQACVNGTKLNMEGNIPSGYTGFFSKGF